MTSRHDLEQLLGRIEDSLADHKGELKVQFARSIEAEEWHLSDNLRECAQWIEAGISACDQMRAHLDAAGAAKTDAPSTVDPSSPTEEFQATATPISSRKEDWHDHPFWPLFFEKGIPLHPELAGKKPTGGHRKISTTISPGIQIDVTYSTRGARCRLWSNRSNFDQGNEHFDICYLLKVKERAERAGFDEDLINQPSSNLILYFEHEMPGKVTWYARSVSVEPSSGVKKSALPGEKMVDEVLSVYSLIKECLATDAVFETGASDIRYYETEIARQRLTFEELQQVHQYEISLQRDEKVRRRDTPQAAHVKAAVRDPEIYLFTPSEPENLKETRRLHRLEMEDLFPGEP